MLYCDCRDGLVRIATVDKVTCLQAVPADSQAGGAAPAPGGQLYVPPSAEASLACSTPDLPCNTRQQVLPPHGHRPST